MSTPAMGKFKQLTKQVSRSIVRVDPETLLPEEKLTLSDTKIDHESEFTWNVKIKSTDGSMKLDRTLVIGPNGCRLHLPVSLDVIDDIPYTRMKEFSYNAEHHVFQISWQQAGSNTIEIIHFHTRHCVEIHETIQKFLKDILRSKKTGDPDAIMARCTYLRPVNLTELKKGGRHKSEIPPEEVETPIPPSPTTGSSRSRNAPTRSLSVQPTHQSNNSKKREEATEQRPRKKEEKEKPTNQKSPRSPKSPKSPPQSTSQKSPRSPKSPKSPRPRKTNNNNASLTESDERKSHHTKKISSPRAGGTPRSKEKETQDVLEITKDSESSSSSEEQKPAKKQVNRDSTKKDSNITYKLSRDSEKAKSPKRTKSPPKLIDIGEENSE